MNITDHQAQLFLQLLLYKNEVLQNQLIDYQHLCQEKNDTIDQLRRDLIVAQVETSSRENDIVSWKEAHATLVKDIDTLKDANTICKQLDDSSSQLHIALLQEERDALLKDCERKAGELYDTNVSLDRYRLMCEEYERSNGELHAAVAKWREGYEVCERQVHTYYDLNVSLSREIAELRDDVLHKEAIIAGVVESNDANEPMSLTEMQADFNEELNEGTLQARREASKDFLRDEARRFHEQNERDNDFISAATGGDPSYMNKDDWRR